MHAVKHVCSPLESEVPGLGTQRSKQFLLSVCGGDGTAVSFGGPSEQGRAMGVRQVGGGLRKDGVYGLRSGIHSYIDQSLGVVHGVLGPDLAHKLVLDRFGLHWGLESGRLQSIFDG